MLRDASGRLKANATRDELSSLKRATVKASLKPESQPEMLVTNPRGLI